MPPIRHKSQRQFNWPGKLWKALANRNVPIIWTESDLGPYQLSIGLPSVITGLNHRVRFPSDVTPIVALYQSPWGP